jgi:2'-5' RNA ligase
MRYFIGTVIEQEPAWYYDAITADLARQFDIQNLSQIAPPHITLKAPFEIDDVSEVETKLGEISKLYKKIPAVIEGFDVSEESGTVFLSVHIEKEYLQKIEEIIRLLEPLGENKKWEFFPFRPHISVARRLDLMQLKAVRNYVQTLPAPRFEAFLGNLTLLRFEKPEWMIADRFPLSRE